MPGFNLANYEPVEDRLARFWAEHAEGQVLTELVPAPEGQWIVKATIYRGIADAHPSATGYAHEHVTDRGVNSTSALENCETSAIGRALANLGYAPKGARPSREEMQKADRIQPDPVDSSRVTREKGDPLGALRAEILHAAAPPKFATKDDFLFAFHESTGQQFPHADESSLRNFLASLKPQEVPA